MVLQAYRQAWSRRWTNVVIFAGARLLSIAVLSPITVGIAAAAISLSGQAALTDQDIARFFLTPVGFLALLGMVAVIFAGSVVAIGAMMIDRMEDHGQGVRSFLLALRRIGARLPRLLEFAIRLTLRILVIMLPFVLVGLVAADSLIGAHDINFYLTERPPEFLTFVAIAAVLLAAMAVLLVWRCLGWALAFQIVLLEPVSVPAAFAESRTRMAGRQVGLLGTLVAWVVIWLGTGTVLAGLFGWLLETLPIFLSRDLRTALTIFMSLAVLWMIANLIVSAIAMGALASILTGLGGPRTRRASAPAAAERLAPSLPWLLAGVVAVAIAGVVAGNAILSDAGTDKEIVVIAHRGSAGSRPENTLASIEQAVAERADWVEIDVQETADGEVVVIHDSDFMKTAGNPLQIWDATMDDLARIDIGSWFDLSYADQRTPRLAEALEAVRDRSRLLIELKYYGHDVDLAGRTAAIVDAAGMAGQVAVMSLKYPAVQEVQGLRPDWTTGILAATAMGDLTRLDGDFIAVSKASVGPRLVEAADAAGKAVYVWTVNDPVDISAMASMGVDGLITDEPALARKVLEIRQGMSPAERVVLMLAARFGIDLSLGAPADDRP